MNYDTENISIADWHNLTQETQSVVDKALRHLEERQAADPKEAKKIEEWKNTLGEHSIVINEIKSGYEQGLFKEPRPEAKQEYIIVNDRMQISRDKIQYLPQQDFTQTQSALDDLIAHTKMFISAGPHGPGGGKPRPGGGVRGPGAGPTGWGSGRDKGPKGGGGIF
ncbi:MAG TPA: hypothetical protein VFR24_28035 [Candidatus Angelobacter sp.]|nr:hypothetical protein [Candidatus Angelobacter sp.]